MRGGTGLRIIMTFLLLVCIFLPPMSGALTTFGKSNPQNQNQNPPPPPTPVGKARDCKTESDCSGIQNTSCVADHRDGKTRCLCGDYSAPLNGACHNKFKALHATCNSDSECIEDAHCVTHNNTIKRCYCREGFVQDTPFFCNGCSSISPYTTILLAVLFVLNFNFI